MSLAQIGPVALTLFNPSFSWGSAPTASGVRQASISGLAEWPVVHHLSELVNNAERHVTIGADAGVLEYVHASDELLAPFRGWYLLQDFTLSPEQPHSTGGLTRPTPFSISGAYLGDHTFREVLVTHSAHERANAYELVGEDLIVNPFYDEDANGGEFALYPGGTRFTREYDAVPVVKMDPIIGSSRRMTIYRGPVGSLASAALPILGAPEAGVLRWVGQTGGDVRVVDRNESRQVGAGHPFARPTDIMVSNGLVRFWLGNRLSVPFVNVSARRTGDWREVGCLAFGRNTDEGRLTGWRVESVTPEQVTVAMQIRGLGDTFLTLQRGERMIRVAHGPDRYPLAGGQRYIGWLGGPPASIVTADTAIGGRFGRGLDLTDPTKHVAAQLVWPSEAPEGGFSVGWWWAPTASSASLGSAYIAAILATGASAEAGRVWWDSTDKKMKFRLGAATVATEALTFAANEQVFIAARFRLNNLSLTVQANGVTHHVTNSAAGGAAGQFTYLSFPVPLAGGTWGQGVWGQGVWGGGLGFEPARGIVSNAMIFSDWLTDAEAEALALTSRPLGGLPTPEARLVLYAPFQARSRPAGGDLVEGLVTETTPDTWGFTRAISALAGAQPTFDGAVGLRSLAGRVDVAAILATADTGDTVTDYRAQHAVARKQEVRIR